MAGVMSPSVFFDRKEQAMRTYSKLKVTGLRIKVLLRRKKSRDTNELFESVVMLASSIILLSLTLLLMSSAASIEAVYYREALVYMLVAFPALKLGIDLGYLVRYVVLLTRNTSFQTNVASAVIIYLGKLVLIIAFYVMLPVFEKILGYQPATFDAGVAFMWLGIGIAIVIYLTLAELAQKFVRHELIRARAKRSSESGLGRAAV